MTVDVIEISEPVDGAPVNPQLLGVTNLVRRITDLCLGALSVAAIASVDAIERFVPAEPGEESHSSPTIFSYLPGALIGFGVATQRQLLRATSAGERVAVTMSSLAARAPLIGVPLRDVEGYLAHWADRGEAEQIRSRALLAEFVRRLAPEVATAVVEKLDLAELVEQMPMDAIVASLDIDALLVHVDVDAIVARVDIPALLDRVDVDAIVARVDIPALLDRVDIDAIVGRVDVSAIVDRLDLGPVVTGVLDQVDIGAIVRESTGSITGGIVNGGRVTAMKVDVFVARVSDKVLFRKKARDLSLFQETSDEIATP
ncbi:MAG: hypothetical protein EXQ69_00055 [Acidimicrobiia bacterium]|nr:hypothetical protein [Acidimicrobiia bacterium]